MQQFSQGSETPIVSDEAIEGLAKELLVIITQFYQEQEQSKGEEDTA